MTDFNLITKPQAYKEAQKRPEQLKMEQLTGRDDTLVSMGKGVMIRDTARGIVADKNDDGKINGSDKEGQKFKQEAPDSFGSLVEFRENVFSSLNSKGKAMLDRVANADEQSGLLNFQERSDSMKVGDQVSESTWEKAGISDKALKFIGNNDSQLEQKGVELMENISLAYSHAN